MKFWLNSDGKVSGGRKFFALVEEQMIDKNGKIVPMPEEVQVAQPEVQAPVTEINNNIICQDSRVDELIKKVAELEAMLANEKAKNATAEVDDIKKHFDNRLDELKDSLNGLSVAPAPAEEPAKEAPVEEPAPVEESPVEEPAKEEAVEEAVEEVVEEPAKEEDAIEEVASADLAAIVVDIPEEPATEEAPEIAPAVAIVATEKAPAVRSRNFAEKMRDASEVLQDRYDELKNYALRFRKLKARISKKFDSINQGRFQFVKLSVAGKTLKLYLNMDINTTDPKFHCKDMSDKKTYVTVPTLLRIKSGRAVKYAKRLIDQCAEQHGMLERRKPFVVDAMDLIEESLKGKDMPDVEMDDVVVEGEE